MRVFVVWMVKKGARDQYLLGVFSRKEIAFSIAKGEEKDNPGYVPVYDVVTLDKVLETRLR